VTPKDSPRSTSKPVRDRLPAVTLPALGAGPAVDLGAFRGPAVVNVWASWCKPCRRELPIYAAFARKHAGKIAVLGVDFQDSRKDKALAMLRAARADYPVVYDFDGETRPFGLPKLILLGADGKIAYAELVEIKSLAQLEGIVAQHLKAT
jgi:thiol-disulfide isomerase/thioredoxin